MMPAPSFGWAQRSASPSLVSSYMPLHKKTSHMHTHAQKSFKILGLLLHHEGESMDANNPWSCPSVAAGMGKKWGCLVKGVSAEAKPAPPALSQLHCTSWLPRGYCHSLPLSPCPELKLQPLLRGKLPLAEGRTCCGKGTHSPDVYLRRGAGRKGTQE